MDESSPQATKLESTGPDWIPAFWYKVFPEHTQRLAECLWRLMEGRDKVPGWFAEGRTVLIPKDSCEGRPDQFQLPITCLNTGYKALTGALAGILKDHAQRVGALPDEQKAGQTWVSRCFVSLCGSQTKLM